MSSEWAIFGAVVILGVLAVRTLEHISQHLLEIKRLLAFQMNQRVD